MVVRNSSTFTNVHADLPLHPAQPFKVTIPMAVLVGILLGLSRLAADSEIIAMRASGLGIGYFVRVASIVAIGGRPAGAGELALRRAPRQPGHPRDAAGARNFAGLLRDPAARLLRGLPQLRPLRAGRARRNRRGQLAPGLHGRRQRPGLAAHHHRRLGHRGERFQPGTAHAPARRRAA